VNIFFLLIRKTRSIFLYFDCYISNFFSHFKIAGNPLIIIGKNCQFGKCVKIRATDGGLISIGKNVLFGDHVQIVIQGGKLTIENNVFIGTGSIVVCKENIFIGSDTLIAEYVVIRDQDHSIESRPVRGAGFHTSPIYIGRDVWIGCKATILRGSSIGDRSVIGAHALVRSSIPADMLAVGVPSRIIKCINKT